MAMVTAPRVKRGAYAKNACTLCRKMKKKCKNNGDGTPCVNCLKKGVVCIYPEKKRSSKRKRREEEMPLKRRKLAADEGLGPQINLNEDTPMEGISPEDIVYPMVRYESPKPKFKDHKPPPLKQYGDIDFSGGLATPTMFSPIPNLPVYSNEDNMYIARSDVPIPMKDLSNSQKHLQDSNASIEDYRDRLFEEMKAKIYSLPNENQADVFRQFSHILQQYS